MDKYPKDIIDNMQNKKPKTNAETLDTAMQGNLLAGGAGAILGLGIGYYQHYNLFASALIGAISATVLTKFLIKK